MNIFKEIASHIQDVWIVYTRELERIIHDKGVITIFFVAVLVYPILYPLIYFHESIDDLPIAVVDRCDSQLSREYCRKLDATREVEVRYKCLSLKEAEQLYNDRMVHGIIYFPEDFDRSISTAGSQAVVSVYCDMSSFLYYKSLLQASNFVMLDYHEQIQVQRYELLGNDHAMAQLLAKPLKYETVMLYNPGNGYPSYLLPAILVLILFQTLFFGICMLAGVAREKNGELYYMEGRHYERSTFRLVIGRAAAYFTIYIGLYVYTLGLVPHLFGLPHIGKFLDIMQLMIPFLLATIFYSMAVSVFIRARETAMVLLLFSSVVLLFLSGASWPTSNIPTFWKNMSYLFPSTFAINAYIHINSCGATIAETSREYIALWIQAGAYFIIASLGYYIFGWYYEKTDNNNRLVNFFKRKNRERELKYSQL